MRIGYSDMVEIMNDIIILWGEEVGGKVIETIHYAPKIEMSWIDFLSLCTACGGNWVGMVASGIKKLSQEVYDALPNNLGEPFKAFATLCNIAGMLGVEMAE